jgi:replicative DNA helicase
MSTARVLPSNTEAEASILGGILLRNTALLELPELEVEDFYDNRHKVVFQAIRNLDNKSRPIDVVTLEDEIQKSGKLDAIGGIAFLGELTLRVPTVDNMVSYAEIVTDKARARRLMLAASEVLERGYDPDLDVREYLDKSEIRILAATARKSSGDGPSTVAQIVKRRVAELDDIAGRRARGEQALTGCPTGIKALDVLLGGYPFGLLSLVAARPAMGKSAFARGAAEAAADVDYGVHVFTLEDSKTTYGDRCISGRTGIPATKIRQADLTRHEASKLVAGVAQLQRYDRWLIDDRGELSAQDIIREVRRHRTRLKTRLVIVDYVQLVARKSGMDENAALTEIMGAFAAAAKDDGGRIAWLIVSQLNRKLEERPDKRPLMSDLRGSGSLEEKVKVAIGLYRGAYYYPEAKKEIDFDCWCAAGTPPNACTHRPSSEEFTRQMQLLLLKCNQGQTGRIFASWDGPTMTMGAG